MPAEVQNRYMSLQLRSFLYGIHYNGSMRSALAPDANDNSQPLDLENNTVLGVDLGFYEQLHNSNSGEGYFDPGWDVVKEESDRTLAVHKGGLTGAYSARNAPPRCRKTCCCRRYSCHPDAEKLCPKRILHGGC